MADPLLSPSTISAWLECDFYLTVKLGGQPAERNHPNAFAELLMAKGLAHEEACLAEFEARGLSIFRTPGREDHETFAQWVSRVGNPMDDGWDVIYQFPMVHDGLRGIADFLVRVPEPTEGCAPYEPYDAKLARLAGEARPCPPALLLRRRYRGADRISTAQDAPVARIRGRRVRSRSSSSVAYWRRLRRRLAAVTGQPHDRSGCAPRSARTASSASTPSSARTPGGPPTRSNLWPASGRQERHAFEDADIATLVELSEVDRPTPPVSAARQDRLRRQAELQVVSRAASGRTAGLSAGPTRGGPGVGTRLRLPPRT